MKLFATLSIILFSKLFFFYIFLQAHGLPSSIDDVSKTVLYIHNQNPKDLVVIIKSEDGDNKIYSNKTKSFINGWGITWVPANTLTQMEISSEDIADTSRFFISGEVNILTPRGVCKGLSAGKSYSVTFIEHYFGTECLHEEVTHDRYTSNQNVQKISYGKSHPFTILNNLNVLFHPSFDVAICS